MIEMGRAWHEMKATDVGHAHEGDRRITTTYTETMISLYDIVLLS
jgi:hypothetical protein